MAKPCPDISTSHRPRRRGAAFIVALLVVTLLSGVVLVFARGMNTSAGAARAEVSQTQARWIARGALEAIRGELAEKIALGEVPRLDAVGVQAEPMGEGLYWVIGRDTETGEPGVGPEEVAFGLVGEAGKLNVNQSVVALESDSSSQIGLDELVQVFGALPGVTSEMSEAYTTETQRFFAFLFASPDVEASDTQQAVVQAQYSFNTVDQLGLLAGFSAEALDGEDANRNGVLDPNEDDGDASPPADNADGRLDYGLREYLTVYSVESLTGDNGEERINLNRGGQGLGPLLQEVTTEDRYNQLVNTIPPARPFSNLPDFFVRSQITAEEFAQVHDRVMVENANLERVGGKIDIYQASPELLDALPGLEPGDGATIVAARPVIGTGEAPGDFAWLVDVLSREKIEAVGDVFTHRSLQFSADVVAVSADGKGFSRLRYVLDCEPVVNGDAELPTVVYVQDLTSLGWPLDPAILVDLRQGMSVEEVNATYGPTGTLGN